MAGEATAENFEHEVEVVEPTRAVEDGEGAHFESGGGLAAGVSVAEGAADDDGRGWLGETGEDVEEPRAAALGVGAGVGAGVHGEAEVNDGDVDGSGLDDA